MLLRSQRATKLALLALLGATALMVPGATAQQQVALPAKVVKLDRPGKVLTFPVTRLTDGGARSGTATWRVVNATGNCCENYLTTTPKGQLLDFGGSYINFTNNRGVSWSSVQPQTPLINGEGTIALAPGGDIVGVEWDPYSGDHLLGFKYEASDRTWYYNEIPVHTPFFDREWIVAVPGPFTINGQKVPYITIVKGAWPSKEIWFYSTDGINYVQAGSKWLDQQLNGRAPRLTTVANAQNDWMQPNTETHIVALGNGQALAAPDSPFGGGEWSLLGKDFKWRSFDKFPSGDAPQGLFQLDSGGRLHNVIPGSDGFTYRISANAGKSWTSSRVSLPGKHGIENIDFHANRAVGIAAVAIHAHDSVADKDRDLVYKLSIRGARAAVTNIYRVGRADIDGSSGVGADIRFDFETVAIFPDGRVAVSFYDSTTKGANVAGVERIQPAVAIELSTRFR